MSSSLNKPTLRLDWCSYEAAKYAVMHWHYSHSMPMPPLARIGVWEGDGFIGCVLFGRGANNNLHKPYGIANTEICELVRVALCAHVAPVSRIVSIAIKMLARSQPLLRLIVSYADPNNGHVGGIYQAGGWLYSGETGADFKAIDKHGRVWHSRQVSHTGVKRQYGVLRRVPRHDDCTLVPLEGKHKYLYPLDAAMRAQIEPLRKPYPKRADEAKETARPASSGETEGARPIRPL